MSQCDEEYTEKAFQDFLNALNRIKTPTTEAMQKGIDFENAVNAVCNGTFKNDGAKTTGKKSTKYSNAELDGIYEIAKIVKGGVPQVHAEKTIEIDGLEVYIHGYLDTLKAGTIYDIKHTSKFEYGKYQYSPQHPMYFELVEEANVFEYLIFSSGVVYREKYRRGEGYRDIKDTIKDFYKFLKESDLWNIYVEKWEVN